MVLCEDRKIYSEGKIDIDSVGPVGEQGFTCSRSDSGTTFRGAPVISKRFAEEFVMPRNEATCAMKIVPP